MKCSDNRGCAVCLHGCRRHDSHTLGQSQIASGPSECTRLWALHPLLGQYPLHPVSRNSTSISLGILVALSSSSFGATEQRSEGQSGRMYRYGMMGSGPPWLV
jgi:hypothetical protein